MKRYWIGVAAALGMLLSGGSVSAHHSATGYDLKTSVLKGTLTQVIWANPHVRVFLDVPEEGGKVTHWVFEGYPPTWFRKVGIRGNDFQKGIGTIVSVTTNVARDGRTVGFFQGIRFADGSSLLWKFQ